MFRNFFKALRTTSLERILAVHTRTIDDLTHFAETRSADAHECRNIAQGWTNQAQEREAAASKAMKIAGKLQENVLA